MRQRERGISLMGLILILFVVVIVGIFSLKLIPAYIEFFQAKAAIEAIAADRARTGSVAEVRKAFDARATIDDIKAISASDLEVGKEGNDVVISFSYRKEVPVVANIGLFVDFAASSKP
jgi:Tfp pilus assembly protein PilE